MALFGSILTISFPYLKCLCGGKDKEDPKEKYHQQLQNINNIKILPFVRGSPIEDLYPNGANTKDWTVLVVGKNKHIIHLKDNLGISKDNITDYKFDNVLTGANVAFFKTLYEMILEGLDSEFLMIKDGFCYLCNVYSLKNAEKEVVGGLVLIRAFETIDDGRYEIRKSREYPRS